MKISNREKIMLFILGIIAIAFGYYNFVYLTQTSIIDKKLNEEAEIKQKYEIAKSTIDSLETKKSDADFLKVKIGDESKPFYPTINEEHIILELDKLLKDNGLEGTIKFEPIVSDSVEGVDKKSSVLADSSLQSIVDKYKNGGSSSNTEPASTNTNDKNNNSSNSNDKGNTSNNSNTNNKANSNTDASKDKKDNKKDTLQYVKVQIAFQGSYDGLYKMLTTIGENQRKIVVNSIKLNSDSEKGMKGTLNLEIYSIPKINDEINDYLKWDFNNSYGKDVPFAADATDQLISTATSKEEKTKEADDFIAAVKSVTSDLPKIMLGRSNDDLRTSYVYGNNNSEEQVEMTLTQDGDKYYYKYRTSKGAYPANYDGLGEEFVPKSKDIVLDILSDNRVDANDNSSMRLKIINKTDKTMQVNIIGDNSSNPRVVIDANEDNIKVNKN